MICQEIWASECENYYYGLGVSQDYRKAYDCFLQQNDQTATEFVIIMLLNGDGCQQDVLKAQTIWEKAVAGNDNDLIDASMTAIGEIIEERVADPKKKYPRIKYSDIARTTLDINFDLALQNRIQEQGISNLLQKLKHDLNVDQKKALASIEQTIKVIEEKDARRFYTIYIDGTIRGAAYDCMKSYLAERYQEKLKQFLMERSLKFVTQEETATADKNLNIIYKKVRSKNQERINKESDILGDREKLMENIKEIDDLFVAAQLAWIKYRDAWVALLKIYKPNGMTDESAIERAVKAQLSLERIDELLYDPIAPEGDRYYERWGN